MSTHNICFHGEIRKIFTRYPPLSRPMHMSEIFNFRLLLSGVQRSMRLSSTHLVTMWLASPSEKGKKSSDSYPAAFLSDLGVQIGEGPLT